MKLPFSLTQFEVGTTIDIKKKAIVDIALYQPALVTGETLVIYCLCGLIKLGEK